MLSVDSIDCYIIIFKILISYIDDVLLGELFHAADFSDVVVPFSSFDEGLTHHAYPGCVEFQAGFLILFKIIYDGRNNPVFETS